MANPFKYGGVVGKGAFCNRKQEVTSAAASISPERWCSTRSDRCTVQEPTTLSVPLPLSIGCPSFGLDSTGQGKRLVMN